MRLSPLTLLLALVLLASCNASQKVTVEAPKKGIKFSQEKQFENVLARAKAENKLVFVDFYADWCSPCKLMDAEVFSDKAIGDFFNKNFINIKVDGEKDNGPDLSAILGIRAFPTVLFLDDIGRIVEKREGSIWHEDLMNMAQNALTQKQSMTYIDSLQ